MPRYPFILGIFICIYSVFTLGAQSQNEVVVNEVLFSVANESSTTHDRLIYQRVLSEVFKKNKISQLIKKASDDFLLSRLSYKEAKAFDMQGVEVKLSQASRKKLSEFSDLEINHEIEVISKAMAIVEIKETQLKQKERFETWFDLLRHKYLLKIKSADQAETL